MTKEDKYLVKCQNCGAESRYRSEGKVVKILLNKRSGKLICKKRGAEAFKLFSIR